MGIPLRVLPPFPLTESEGRLDLTSHAPTLGLPLMPLPAQTEQVRRRLTLLYLQFLTVVDIWVCFRLVDVQSYFAFLPYAPGPLWSMKKYDLSV